MNHLDLFSGIGGFALAAQWVWGDEHNPIAFCEIDPFCQKVLNKHYPDVPIHDDITKLDGKQYAGTVDIITGGDPCQPHSVAGKRKGKEDDRYLWPEMFRIIAEARPDWIINENVVGSVSSGIVDTKSDDLESIGYTCQPFNIPAVAVGANHLRHRIWIVAHATVNRLQRELRKTEPQEIHNGSLEALGVQHWDSDPFSNWQKLLVQPKFCRMDDGISSTVDIRPRLHAYGNAIVPQVAAVIMQAIKQVNLDDWNEANENNNRI